MRMTSRLRSRRLCAFSVFSARMRYASFSSPVRSAVTERIPRRRAASRRWRPLGERKPPSDGTAITGSRNTPVAPMASMSRSACVLERSRWNAVASTFFSGSEASTSGAPAYGSRYAPRTAPPSFSTRATSIAMSVPPGSSRLSRGSGPRGPCGFRERRVAVVFFGAVFVFGIRDP